MVGSPDGKYGYYDRQTISNYQWYKEHDYNYYRVYALGEWGSIKTGVSFYMLSILIGILKQHDISRDFLCIFLLITMFFPIFRFVLSSGRKSYKAV